MLTDACTPPSCLQQRWLQVVIFHVKAPRDAPESADASAPGDAPLPGGAPAPAHGDAPAPAGDAPSDACGGWRWLVVGEAASLARRRDYPTKLGQLEATIAHAQGKLREAARPPDGPEPSGAMEPLHPLDLHAEKVC